MILEHKDIYELNIDKEWDLWYNNHKNINEYLIKFNDIKNLYKKLKFIPIYYDEYCLWLYRSSHVTGSNRTDLIKIELNGTLSFNSTHLTNDELKQLFLNALNIIKKTKEMKKEQKNELPKLIKTLRFYEYRIITVVKGTLYSEWKLFKKSIGGCTMIRIKLLVDKNQPVLLESIFIPKQLVKNIIDLESRETDKEKEYVKYHNLLSRYELILKDCDVAIDEYKTYKTDLDYFGVLDNYYKHLKDNKLEDNLINLRIFCKDLYKKFEMIKKEYKNVKKN